MFSSRTPHSKSKLPFDENLYASEYENVPGFNITAQAERMRQNFETLPYWEAVALSTGQTHEMAISYWKEYLFRPNNARETSRLIQHTYSLTPDGQLWENTYGSISAVTGENTRRGTDKKAILDVEKFLSENNEPGTTALQISPQGPNGLGKLPETQLLLWQITDTKSVELITIRTDQTEIECRKFVESVSQQRLTSRPNTYDSLCEMSATVIGWNPNTAPNLNQLVSKIQSSANRDFDQLENEVKEYDDITAAWESFTKGQRILEEFESQITEIAQEDDAALVIAQAKTGLYHLLLELSAATNNREITSLSGRSAEAASLRTGVGCDAVSESTQNSSSYSSDKPYIEIWKDGVKHIIVYNCGACSQDLGTSAFGLGTGKGLAMKSGDRCPFCNGEYLCG